MEKKFIPVNCNKHFCPHINTCCQVPTEVIINNKNKGIDIFIFGIGAGKDEEKQQRCFVGVSGKYMRCIIKYIWETHSFFNLAISNNVRFHPVDSRGKDREPTKDEIELCKTFLIEDIRKLKPKVIIPVGKNAARTFLEYPQDTAMGKMRGEHIIYLADDKRIIRPTYHPSFLIRQYGSFKPEENNIYDNYFIQDILDSL